MPMGESNTVDCECTVFAGQVDLQYEQSNDLENWTVVGSPTLAVTGPYVLLGGQAVTGAYVRVRCTESIGAPAIVAYGINLSAQ